MLRHGMRRVLFVICCVQVCMAAFDLTWLDQSIMEQAKFHAPLSTDYMVPGQYIIELLPHDDEPFSPLTYFQQIHQQVAMKHGSARMQTMMQSAANNDQQSELISNTPLNMSVHQIYNQPSVFYGASIHFAVNPDFFDDTSSHAANVAAQDTTPPADAQDTNQEPLALAHVDDQLFFSYILNAFFAHDAIVRIYPVTIMKQPITASRPMDDDDAMRLFSDMDDNDDDFDAIAHGPGIRMARRDFSNITDELPADLGKLDLPFNLMASQIKRVHNEMGIRGRGVTIGIVDSGIDYQHQAFGAGFGPTFKIALGYDLVGNRFRMGDPFSREEKNTPLDDCHKDELKGSGHGTHVAGIIAADDKRYNFQGIAPDATIGMWRVFGCSSSTSSDLVIKAMISAFEAGCQIINLSLGGPNNWAQDASAIVANRIATQGVAVVVAAGNEGDQGAFYISSPSTGDAVISVASIDNNVTLQKSLEVPAIKKQFAYELSSTSKWFPNGTLVSYDIDDADNELGCAGTVASHSIVGKVVLVRRGNCTYNEKAKTAAEQGALGVVVYDPNHGMAYSPTTSNANSEAPIPLVAVSGKTGATLLDVLRKNHAQRDGGIEVLFHSLLGAHTVASGGLASNFSSVGPTYQMAMKPNIAGIGGYVFSTLPMALGGYGTLSGTSMASPFVAGCMALFLQANPTTSVADMVERFMNYAHPVPAQDAVIRHPHAMDLAGFLENPVKQGAGLLQLYDGMTEMLHVSPSQLSFNDTEHRQPKNITITNHDTERTAVIEIDQVNSAALLPFDLEHQGFSPLQPPDVGTVNANLKMSATTLTLAPGTSASIQLLVDDVNTSKLDNSTNFPFPIFGGYVQLHATLKNGKNQQQKKHLNVPYMGIHGKVQEMPIFAPGYPYLSFSVPTLEDSDDGDNNEDALTASKLDKDDGVRFMQHDKRPLRRPPATKVPPPPLPRPIRRDNSTAAVTTKSPASKVRMFVVSRLLTGTSFLATEVWSFNLLKNTMVARIGYADIQTYLPRSTIDSHPWTIHPWNGTVLAKLPKSAINGVPLATRGDNDDDDGNMINQPNLNNLIDAAAFNATALPTKPLSPGTYVLHWRALKLLSDPNLDSSWETATSHPFEVTKD